MDVSQCGCPNGTNQKGQKELIQSLSNYMTHSITKGEVPEKSKLGHITPIFKKDSKKVYSNYCGIIVTSSISKLYGRIIKQ